MRGRLSCSANGLLRPGARRSLDSLVQVVNSRYPNFDVVVYGHTDNDPIKKSKWKDNFELSTQRSLSVVRYLQDRGVSPTRLVAGGCGEYRPIASNKDRTGRGKNRRVEVYALDPAIWGAG